MSQKSDVATLGLDYYGFVIRRQWRVVLAAIVLGGLAALGFFTVSPTPVKATAVINLSVISTDPFDTSKQASSLLDGTTETQIATSYAVARDAARELGAGTAPDEVRRRLSVDSETGASIVQITYAAPTSEQARAGADAVAESYLAYRTSRAQAKLDSILQGVKERGTVLGTLLTDANSRISEAAAGTLAANQASSDRDLVTIELNALLAQKGALEQVDTTGGEVITEAARNNVVVQPTLFQLLLIGLLAGGMLGVVGAFAANRFDHRMRNANEVRRVTEAPVLADIHSVDASIPHDEATLELLRAARERIFADLPPAAQVIAIVDDTPEELHADIPVSLALVTAAGGVHTTLTLPNASPDLKRVLGVSLELTDALPEQSGEVFRSERVPELTVSFPSRVGPAIGPCRGGEVRFVVIDRSTSQSSALAALRISDAVLLVAVKHRTRADDAEQIVDEASRLAIKFLGTITVPLGRIARTTAESRGAPRRTTVRSAATRFSPKTLFARSLP
jgi:capsular polysaccharide biosynthesis protein